MKILKLLVRYPPAPGGVEFQQHAICRELAKRGHDIEVYTSDLYSEIPFKRLDGDYPEIDGIPVTRFKARSLGGDFQYSIMPSMMAKVLSGKWDIIHAHSYGFFPSHVGALGGRLKRGTFVFTPHLHPMQTTWGGPKRMRIRNLYDRFFARTVVRQATKVICVSQGEMEHAVQSGIGSEKIVIVPDSVDIKRFEGVQKGLFKKRFKIDSDYVLFVGRLAKNKGLRYLVEAASTVLKKLPHMKIVLIGEDEGMRSIFTQRTKELGVEKSFIFTGLLENDTVTAAFVDCSLFVLPSEFEAFGIVLAEAQAAKKPCVATRVGGIPEVVRDGVAGLLVDYKDSKALASAMIDILEDEDKRRRFGEAGYEWVANNFAVEMVVPKLEEVYKNALHGNINTESA